MNLKIIINICFVAALITSCEKSEKYENASLFSFQDFKTITKLNATTIDFDQPLMKPLLFVLSDSLLIMHNIRTEYVLHVYNINSRKKVGEVVPWGSGPNELLRIKNLQLVDSDLYISDSGSKRVYKYNVNDFHKSSFPVPIHKISTDDLFFSSAYTNDGYVATTLNPHDKRLVFYDSEGEKDFMAGEYPYYGKELTDIEKMEGFSSSIAVNQKHERIYLFGMDTDLIEIYDFKGNFIKRIHGPEQFFPQVKQVSLGDGYSGASFSEKARSAFFSPVVIEDEIYVSYSGNHLEMDKEIAPFNHILVFDKDCNPVRGYELSKPIVAFSVDPKTKYIYATCNIPDFHLLVFKPE